MEYKEKAEIILDNNFRLFGIGHFDLLKEDIIELLQLLDEPNSKQKVKELYDKLEKQRMG